MVEDSIIRDSTRKVLSATSQFDLDHLLPLTVYPVNDLWNLLPTDSTFNQHTKRDHIPDTLRLPAAQPLIAAAYGNYEKSEVLSQAVREDAGVRFVGLPTDRNCVDELARHTIHFIEEVASARNVARF